jgi:hypothetical protein
MHPTPTPPALSILFENINMRELLLEEPSHMQRCRQKQMHTEESQDETEMEQQTKSNRFRDTCIDKCKYTDERRETCMETHRNAQRYRHTKHRHM